MIVLTAHVPNIQFETSGFLQALVHFSDVGHLDLTHLACPAKSSWASLAQETQDLAILGKMFIRSWQDLTYIKKRMPHLDYNAKMSRSNIGSWQDCCKMLQI